MEIEYVLGITSFFTSMIAGIFGFGGGMLLIAIMPNFMHPSLVIPIHGVTQLASNTSRMLFSLKNVIWAFMPKFLIGSLVGMFAFGSLLTQFSFEYLPLGIGLYILLNLWSKRFSKFISRFESFYIIGFLQTGLGLFVGAPGPLAITVLSKKLESKDEIVATGSMFMTISHLAKIPVYYALTTSLFEHVPVVIAMVMGSILGSFVGTKLRVAADNKKLITVIKVLISLLAVKMLVSIWV
ncbi:TSUP family transporter [Vibrio chagasii]|uniref:TSUP family transporter n=1 Tax=Vibrio chagasii TaxID=170679 RepID=UPI003DA8CE14